MGNLISGTEKYRDSTLCVCVSLSDLLADLPPQLSIDALNTTTPNLADLMADLPPPPN